MDQHRQIYEALHRWGRRYTEGNFKFKTDKARQAVKDEREWRLRRTKNVKVKKNQVKILMLKSLAEDDTLGATDLIYLNNVNNITRFSLNLAISTNSPTKGHRHRFSPWFCKSHCSPYFWCFGSAKGHIWQPIALRCYGSVVSHATCMILFV